MYGIRTDFPERAYGFVTGIDTVQQNRSVCTFMSALRMEPFRLSDVVIPRFCCARRGCDGMADRTSGT